MSITRKECTPISLDIQNEATMLYEGCPHANPRPWEFIDAYLQRGHTLYTIYLVPTPRELNQLTIERAGMAAEGGPPLQDKLPPRFRILIDAFRY